MAKVFAAMLMAVGVLMTVLCGLCSLAFLVGPSQSGGGKWISVVPIVLVVGGVPTVLGVVLVVVGLLLFRGPREARHSKNPPDASTFN